MKNAERQSHDRRAEQHHARNNPIRCYESEVARLERTIKRLFIICVLLIIVAVGTNAYWIWYEAQFDDIVTTVTQDVDSGEGGDAIRNALNQI